MHLGIHVVQPPCSNPTAVLQTSARAAESLGYRSIWVDDRLVDREARIRGEGRPLDALTTLAFLAASTERIRLGTSVLAGGWYPPALLARTLATVDHLSRGRLTVGIGPTGDAADDSLTASAGDLTALIAALDAAWAPEQATVPADAVDRPGPQPFQLPRPPLLLAGATPAALDRVGRIADGWHAADDDPDRLTAGWDRVRAAAADAGRDPAALTLVVRIRVDAGDGRHVAGRIAEAAACGAHEVILDAARDLGLDEALARYADVADAVELQTNA